MQHRNIVIFEGVTRIVAIICLLPFSVSSQYIVRPMKYSCRRRRVIVNWGAWKQVPQYIFKRLYLNAVRWATYNVKPDFECLFPGAETHDSAQRGASEAALPRWSGARLWRVLREECRPHPQRAAQSGPREAGQQSGQPLQRGPAMSPATPTPSPYDY